MEVGVADPVYISYRFYDFISKRSKPWAPNTSMERISFRDIMLIIHRPLESLHSILFWLENGRGFCSMRTITCLGGNGPMEFEEVMKYFLSQIRQKSDRRRLGYVNGAPLILKIGVVSN